MRPLQVRILGLNFDPEPTGIAPYTSGMARFLADAGHDVHVVTGYPHYPYWRRAEGYGGIRIEERHGPVHVTRVRHPVPSGTGGAGRIAAEAIFAAHAATVGETDPDVILAVSPALLSVAAAYRRRRARTAVGVVVQDLYGRAVTETGALGGRGASSVTALERNLLGRADGLVAIHDTFRESLLQMGMNASRISVIRNWTHTRPPQGDPGALRARLGWDDGRMVALHAGNMGSKQGLENVVEAARIADRRRLPIRFVLLGSGNQRAELERIGHGLERLQFVDPLPNGEFETALAAADALILNERPEVAEMCVPSKLTSYFAAGRPVVAATNARSAAAHEVTASGGGRCVTPGDPEALLDGLLAINETQGQVMGVRGRRYAQEVLAEDTARHAYVDWVEGLVARPRVLN
ncbi:glycosyltransferase involved in cell wall biosynthesis [Pseudonocardia sediminis]|uniref:Glycosyltransferase involved in cell wall biosynthesis n=1 Tax=Pseudonocardia sediminis TaxID=1397368 RepID=A0A4Q7V0C3_PSEST|nr:glycosyltransferase [Pseudonocardia sediminis]RZT87892.1 glycosyltransferase involved in cell wall biosynthesis [Pseudonocardia sediminis]